MYLKRVLITLSIMIVLPYKSFADVVTEENYTHSLAADGTLNVVSGGSISVTGSHNAVSFGYSFSNNFESYVNTAIGTSIVAQGIAIKHQGGVEYEPYCYTLCHAEANDLNITNAGSISAATAIKTNNVALYLNNSGSVLGDISSSEAFIINSGTIMGNITAEAGTYNRIGAFSVINSGTIIGDIDLGETVVNWMRPAGDPSDSYVTLNDGSITGDITMRDSTHVVNLNGGVYNGEIDGASASLGTVNVNSDQTFSMGDNGVENLNILSDGVFNMNSTTLRAADIALAGELNLGHSNRNIVGNITGNGSSNLNIGSGSHLVDGDVTIQSGDTISVTLSQSGDVGKVTSLGTVTVQSGAKIAATVGSTYSYINDGAKYKLISGDSESNIAAVDDANINVNGSGTNKAFSILTFSSSAENNGLYLHASRASAVEVSDNQTSQAVYSIINDIGSDATGELKSLQQYLDSSTSKTQLNAALQSATPQDGLGTQANRINTLNNSVLTIEKRLDYVRLASHSDRKELKISSRKKASGIASGGVAMSQEMWGQVFGTASKQSKSSEEGGFKAKSNGIAFGYDKQLSRYSRVGVAASYANARVKSSDNLKRTDVDTYQANLYYGKTFGKYFFDTIVGFAWNEYHANRSIMGVNQAATAKYSGQSYISKARAGLNKELGSGFSVIPQVSINFVHNANSAYLEDGAGTANLEVQASATNFLEGRAGVKLSHYMMTKMGSELTQEIRASYGYDFIGDRQTITSNFAGQTASFTAVSAKIDQRSFKMGVGVELTNIHEMTLSLDYNFEKKSDYQSHSGLLKARYGF